MQVYTKKGKKIQAELSLTPIMSKGWKPVEDKRHLHGKYFCGLGDNSSKCGGKTLKQIHHGFK